MLDRLWNHARILSWNQIVLSNEGKVSGSRKQRGPLMGLKSTTSTLRVRCATHCAKLNIRSAIGNYKLLNDQLDIQLSIQHAVGKYKLLNDQLDIQLSIQHAVGNYKLLNDQLDIQLSIQHAVGNNKLLNEQHDS